MTLLDAFQTDGYLRFAADDAALDWARHALPFAAAAARDPAPRVAAAGRHALEALGAERRPVVTLDSDMLDEGEKKKKERSPTAWGFRAGHADKRSWEQARDERHKQAARAPAAAAGACLRTVRCSMRFS